MGECRKVTQHTGLVCRGTSSPKREGCGFSASEIEFPHYANSISVPPRILFANSLCFTCPPGTFPSVSIRNSCPFHMQNGLRKIYGQYISRHPVFLEAGNV